MEDRKAEAELTLVEGSGNVFADLGIADAEESMAKARLAGQIALAIRDLDLTQKQAAERMGLDQPKVSALMRGKLAGFSIERLVRGLVALDRDVEITVRPKPESRDHARVVVVER
ncbi:helix-turn-helix domain-containing protein [Azospirillum rugosum]|uniref:XRE-type DNA-binding protein n=1 Tax=Azospirillum rugosum TaxID=416170 RepID=A0ABS4SPN1_9PROT|nr:helix-turn-helix transcriptional regulator [Azospirillum rugosum]MBP2294513.1 putative XRE-type DNA-binding protein [Azospirillum rugosum]MDQ0529018.1 putative XRE-type DNA-binding protein [Azospirillum rugosum]